MRYISKITGEIIESKHELDKDKRNEMLKVEDATKEEVLAICINCHFWDNKGFEKTYFGGCDCPKFIDMSYEMPQGKSLNKGECKEEDTDILYYTDGEMNAASFVVGKNFGCIHFKAKVKK